MSCKPCKRLCSSIAKKMDQFGGLQLQQSSLAVLTRTSSASTPTCLHSAVHHIRDTHSANDVYCCCSCCCCCCCICCLSLNGKMYELQHLCPQYHIAAPVRFLELAAGQQADNRCLTKPSEQVAYAQMACHTACTGTIMPHALRPSPPCTTRSSKWAAC